MLSAEVERYGLGPLVIGPALLFLVISLVASSWFVTSRDQDVAYRIGPGAVVECGATFPEDDRPREECKTAESRAGDKTPWDALRLASRVTLWLNVATIAALLWLFVGTLGKLRHEPRVAFGVTFLALILGLAFGLYSSSTLAPLVVYVAPGYIAHVLGAVAGSVASAWLWSSQRKQARTEAGQPGQRGA